MRMAGVSGLEKLAAGREDELNEDEFFGVEAIVLLEGRPAIRIRDDDFDRPDGDWAVLDAQRPRIRESIARVGRIEVSGHLSYDWVGTAFLVSPEAVMTNRHVAVEFARDDGAGWTFQPGLGAGFNPAVELRERSAPAGDARTVAGIVGVHPEVDLAVLRLEPTTEGQATANTPVVVAADPPEHVVGRQVYVVGYPAWDGRRNEPEPMRRIFTDVYDVKRLQPGRMTELVPDRFTVKHDCSTLGGNSGSPVFDLDGHRVLGLHFGGRYGVGNVAVPLWQLVNDPLLRRAGVSFG
jgi:S1-C subfamily serine protease